MAHERLVTLTGTGSQITVEESTGGAGVGPDQ
jgi:hypothetical protein